MDHDSIIRQMAAAMATHAAIGAVVGMNRGQVRRYMVAHGITGRPKGMANPTPPDTADKVRALIRDGVSAHKAAELCGVTDRTAEKIRNAEGFGPQRLLFSAAEDAILRDMHAQGKQAPEIAAALPGRSVSSVHSRAAVLGLSFPKDTKRNTATFDLVRQMVAEGKSDRQIAEHLGMSRSGLSSLRRSIGVPCAPEQRTSKHDAVKDTVRELVAQRKSREEIAQATGLTETVLNSIMSRSKLTQKHVAPKKEAAPKPPPPMGLIAGCIPVGLHRAWQWWQEQGRQGRPEIGEINDLRRRMKRAPFTLMRGRFTGISP